MIVERKPDVRDDSPAAELGLAGELGTTGGGALGGTAAFFAAAPAAVAGKIGCSETSFVSLR